MDVHRRGEFIARDRRLLVVEDDDAQRSSVDELVGAGDDVS